MLHELGELYPLISSLIVVVALTLRLKTRAIGIRSTTQKRFLRQYISLLSPLGCDCCLEQNSA